MGFQGVLGGPGSSRVSQCVSEALRGVLQVSEAVPGNIKGVSRVFQIMHL